VLYEKLATRADAAIDAFVAVSQTGGATADWGLLQKTIDVRVVVADLTSQAS
jgi:hypothetical protein